MIISHQFSQHFFSSSLYLIEILPSVDQQSEFSQQESRLIVPVFQKCDDPIDVINHMMAFLTAVVTSHYPTTNNQLRNSSNLRQQATINNGRLKQCGPNFSYEDELAFLADPRIPEGQATQTIISHNVAYQVDDLDAYDSDCDKLNTAKVAVQNSNSSAQQDDLILSEKKLVITTLKDELGKLKGKDLANNEVTHHLVFLKPEINTEPITPKLLNKRSAHSAYIRHTQEEAVVLRDLVDHIQVNYPLDPTLKSAFKFENDHVAKILGYGDYQIGNVTISRVYYVEGLGHNLFSVGQFCDSNLEVAFRQHTCFIRNLEGVDLLTGSQATICILCLLET
ncbi:hypothetical protein Tco_1458926 [Tanacetum coccineum]